MEPNEFSYILSFSILFMLWSKGSGGRFIRARFQQVKKSSPTRLPLTEPERRSPPAWLTPSYSQPIRRSVQPSKDAASNKPADIVTEKIELYELHAVPERR
ncbi:unnamed protein product [Arctia plantaginis]|uniref:Uncharacterized protein n=1 Tax=Arctia plantaginis TaxID=874455 RepID=A0A8S1B861_ARCPL|nr:unnamed protein product [Arctia plantaginis]